MAEFDFQQLIVVGDRTLPLPDSVNAAEWALERNQYQNPRIRTLLGTISLLERVHDSNYAILHCSPARLQEIWRQVLQVVEVLRTRVEPLFEQPSVIPKLEEVRQHTRAALNLMSRHLLTRLDLYPVELPHCQLTEVRKLVCVTIGQLHGFLQDTFGAVMAADPRSTFDKDYYLSKRFTRDIEEAEWLHRSVVDLDNFLQDMTGDSARVLVRLVERLESEMTLPSDRAWESTEAFVARLGDLVEKMREVLALRGIRFDEMEVLDHYAQEVPAWCTRLTSLRAAGREAVAEMMQDRPKSWHQRERLIADLESCHAVFSNRITELAQGLHDAIEDLASFVPLWLVSIGHRRALLLCRVSDALQDPELLQGEADQADTAPIDVKPPATAARYAVPEQAAG
jgi:hypothetical protein